MASVQEAVERDAGLSGRRIVLATFGSLGDLHPFLALAKECQQRGAEPIVATSEVHRVRVERLGLAFRPIRPDLRELEHDPVLFRKAMDRKSGSEFVFREIFMPHLRAGFDDLLPVVRDADLLVSHPIVFVGPLVAEATGIPWASVMLAPMSFVSTHDFPVLPQFPWMRHFRPLGPRFFAQVVRHSRRMIAGWTEPVERLRREVGLPPGGLTFFEGSNAPDCVLALFSELLGAPQPDWPPQTVQTGFAFFDDAHATGMDAGLARFLDAGPPPIVFTLGSSAVMDAGPFYEESRAAAEAIGRRAVLLIGNDPRNVPRIPLPSTIVTHDYAPYSELFPRAAALVHQGGVGTTGQALRAGKPMLVVPWSHDQPDNAERVRRLGVGLPMDRERYRSRAVAKALRRLLDDPAYAARADEVGRRIRSEPGTVGAVDALARYLGSPACRSTPSPRARDRTPSPPPQVRTGTDPAGRSPSS